MKRKKNIQREQKVDRHLDVPAEANRDKHANFVALERGENDPSTENSERLMNRKSLKKSRGK